MPLDSVVDDMSLRRELEDIADQLIESSDALAASYTAPIQGTIDGFIHYP